MAEIASPIIRSTVTDDEFGGFRIVIPARENVRRVFGLALAVWILVMALALWSSVTSPRPMTLEGIKFYGVWTVIGSLVVLIPAAMGIAREMIVIEGKSLVLRKDIAGFSKTRTFELTALRNLRPIASSDDSHPGRRPDQIAFDHNGRTYRFGRGLSEHEVMRLIKTIRARFPIRDAWEDVEPLPVVK
jgi:hypothetical protein